jgi:hypothetical protein
MQSKSELHYLYLILNKRIKRNFVFHGLFFKYSHRSLGSTEVLIDIVFLSNFIKKTMTIKTSKKKGSFKFLFSS